MLEKDIYQDIALHVKLINTNNLKGLLLRFQLFTDSFLLLEEIMKNITLT